MRPGHGVADGARLLEDFLLHEMLVAAFFGHDRVPGDVLDARLDRFAFEVGDADTLGRQHGDVAIGEEEHVARVEEDGRNVAGDEVFVIPETHDDRRAGTRGDDFLRIPGGENRQRIDAGKPLDGFAHGVFQRTAIHIFFDEMGDDFGVGFGDELVAFARQFVLQLEIILDDAVVHDDDFAFAVAMRMGVLFGGAAVGGPARVAEAVNAVDGRLADRFLEIGKLAGCAAEFEVAFVVDNGDAGGVIAAVFEAPEAVDNEGYDFLGSDISDNAAHGWLSLRSGTGRRRKPEDSG